MGRRRAGRPVCVAPSCREDPRAIFETTQDCTKSMRNHARARTRAYLGGPDAVTPAPGHDNIFLLYNALARKAGGRGLAPRKHNGGVRLCELLRLPLVVETCQQIADQFEARDFLLVAADNPPWHFRVARAPEHVIARLAVRLPLLQRLGIDRRELPLRERILRAFGKPLFLLRPRDVEIIFADFEAVAHEHGLERHHRLEEPLNLAR